MNQETQSILLRIFVGEYDKIGHSPFYEEIVYAAKKSGLAGATVTKGIMSYGANSRIHKSKLLALSEDLPVVIEIVDSQDRIDAFMADLDRLFDQAGGGGLITIEKVKVKFYGVSGKPDSR